MVDLNLNLKKANEHLVGAPSLSQKILDNYFHNNVVISKEFEDSRPIESFQKLMLWVKNSFIHYLDTKDNINNFIHNRICIDENFILFAEENKITISMLYKDAVVSWKNTEEENKEKFLMQGVFKISKDNFEFLHSALFHKGCNNEDEISFFITCSSKHFDKYIKLRNDFDEWLRLRDRESDVIAVIGGDSDGIPFTRDHSWGDLFLPESIKKDIKNTVDIFLSSKDWYLENNIAWKKGLFLHGVQGNGKTSIIRTIISEYNFKPVTIGPGGSTDDVKEAFEYAERQSPSLLYFEDLDSLLATGQVNHSSFLNFMDGVSSKNGLFVIATANRPELLPANVIDRPSRFDRKFEIPVPDLTLSLKYLKKWFGTKLNSNFLNKICKKCVKEKLTYAYLKELYILSMYNAISENRKTPKESDVNSALKQILAERILSSDGNLINVNGYLDEESE